MSPDPRIHPPSPTTTKISAVLYGKGGTGKTTLLGTMPGQGLVLDVPEVEGGTVVLSDKQDSIGVWDVHTWEDYEAAYQYLRTHPTEYQWVSLDTLTAAQELAKRKAVAENPLGELQRSISPQDWGRIGMLMTELIFQFRKLPQHIIFVAQENHRDPDDGPAMWEPAVSPMTMNALIPPQFLVGRLTNHDVPNDDGTLRTERRLRVAQNEHTWTKYRAVPGRTLPPIIVDPNLGQIFGWLLGAPNVEQPEGATTATGSALFAATTD